MNRDLAVVIMAAGMGTRMKSELPKVLHPLLGRPMIHHVIGESLLLEPGDMLPVLSWKRESIEDSIIGAFGFPFTFVHQKAPDGTGDALRSAMHHLRDDTTRVLVLSGDVPLVTHGLLVKLLAAHTSPVTIATTRVPDPSGYGRILRDAGGTGRIAGIVEERHATDDEKAIPEINAGIYCFDRSFLAAFIPRLTKNPHSGEYYLTQLVDLAVAHGIRVSSFQFPDYRPLLGVNSRKDLAEARRLMQARVCDDLMAGGVAIIDPSRVYIEPGVAVGADATIWPDVQLCGTTTIGTRCTIEAGSIVSDSRIGDDSHIRPYSVIDRTDVDTGATIGPFAHLRPGSVIGPSAKIGNFVEVKKSTIMRGAKANHLSYIGDSIVEDDVNIGAGTITCNYDGVNKHATRIGRGAFIGSDTCLVAPVVIGRDAVIGAGSVITKDVPDGALAVERSSQKTISNWRRPRKKA